MHQVKFFFVSSSSLSTLHSLQWNGKHFKHFRNRTPIHPADPAYSINWIYRYCITQLASRPVNHIYITLSEILSVLICVALYTSIRDLLTSWYEFFNKSEARLPHPVTSFCSLPGDCACEIRVIKDKGEGTSSLNWSTWFVGKERNQGLKYGTELNLSWRLQSNGSSCINLSVTDNWNIAILAKHPFLMVKHVSLFSYC